MGQQIAEDRDGLGYGGAWWMKPRHVWAPQLGIRSRGSTTRQPRFPSLSSDSSIIVPATQTPGICVLEPDQSLGLTGTKRGWAARLSGPETHADQSTMAICVYELLRVCRALASPELSGNDNDTSTFFREGGKMHTNLYM